MAATQAENIEYIITSRLAKDQVDRDLKALESAIQSSSGKIEAMEANTASLRASHVHMTTVAQKEANNVKIKLVQEGLRIEKGALETLIQSYKGYQSAMVKANQLGLQGMEQQIAKTKELINLTTALGARPTSQQKVSTGYGIQASGATASDAEYSPISMISSQYTKTKQIEEQHQKELDVLFDKTTKARFDKAIAMEEETNLRKMAIRKLDEEASKKLALDKERLYQKINQNMLESAQITANKNSDIKAKARLEEIRQEDSDLKRRVSEINKAQVTKSKALEEEQKLVNAGYNASRKQALDFATYNDVGYKKSMQSMKEYYAELERQAKKAEKIVVAGQKTNINQPTAGLKDSAGRRVYGDYTDLSSGNTMKADAGKVWQNMQADASKAGAAAGREYSKTFWGAVENGTTFMHKMYTTASYAAAGSAFYGLASGATAVTEKFLEVDAAQRRFIGILGTTNGEAKALEKQLEGLSIAYGSNLKDLNAGALALGRAGVKTRDLAEATRTVTQIALASGETFDTITELLVSWKSLYPEKTFTQLGDEITTAANASTASIADFKTMTTYMLASAQQAGITSQMALALDSSFRQVGIGASTTGTELRRFFTQLSTGSKDVRKVFDAIGVDIKKFKEALKAGGDQSDAAMLDFVRKMQEHAKTGGQKAIDEMGAVLDKSVMQVLLATSKTGNDGYNVLDRIFQEIKNKSTGASKKAADEIAGSYENVIKRIKNSATSGLATGLQGLIDTTFTTTKPAELELQLSRLNKTMETLVYLAAGSLAAFTAWKSITAVATISSGIATAVTSIIGFTTGVWGSVTAINASTAAMVNLARVSRIAMGVVGGIGIGVAAYVGYKVYEVNSEDDTRLSKKQVSGMSDTDLQIEKAKKLTIAKEVEDRAWLGTEEAKRKRIASLRYQAAQLDFEILLRKKVADQKSKEDLENQLAAAKALADEQAKLAGIGGNTPEIPKESDARRLAKNELDNKLEGIRLAEQQYFIERDITDTLAQKAYHVDVTLQKEYEAIRASKGAYQDANDFEAAYKKKQAEKSAGQVELNALFKKSTLEHEKQLRVLGQQKDSARFMTEQERINLDTQNKLTEAREKYNKLLTDAKSIRGQAGADYRDRIRNELQATKGAINAQGNYQLSELDRTRNIEAKNYRKTTARTTEDLEAQTEYQKYSISLTSEMQEIEKELADNRDLTAAQIQSRQERITQLTARNNYATYAGMTLQQSMQNQLNSSLMDFFDIQSEGWMDFERLGMSVLQNILQEMLKMQVVQPMASAGSSMLGSLGTMAMNWLASANGNVFDNGHVSAYAKGGTFTNSIVRKPTYFASGGTLGVMGEAGAESVMPLKRSASGELGVIAMGAGGGTQQVTVTIHNEAGEQLSVTKSEARTDMGEMFLDVWLDAAARNRRGVRDIIRGSR